jgi:hypothetical protein
VTKDGTFEWRKILFATISYQNLRASQTLRHLNGSAKGQRRLGKSCKTKNALQAGEEFGTIGTFVSGLSREIMKSGVTPSVWAEVKRFKLGLH